MSANPRGVYEKVKGSDCWWIRYHDAEGKRHRERVGPKSLAVKRYLLRKAEIYENRFFPPKYGPSVAGLKEGLYTDYRLKGQNLEPVDTSWKRLEPAFGRVRAEAVTTERLVDYLEKRTKEGYAGGSLNRDMAILKRMYKLAMRQTPPKVRRVPVFPPRLKESRPRSGFVVDQQFERLMRLPMETWLRAFITIAYRFGLRKEELLSLRVGQVDLETRVIRLEPGTTKNEEGRIAPMTEDVYRLLRECLKNKKRDDYVLTRGKRRVIDFRGTWDVLTKAAGMSGLLVHDLRRSAVRNMIRSGIPERVAMVISGHKTRSVFDRYNIVSEADIREAARRLGPKSRGTKKGTSKSQGRGHTGNPKLKVVGIR